MKKFKTVIFYIMTLLTVCGLSTSCSKETYDDRISINEPEKGYISIIVPDVKLSLRSTDKLIDSRFKEMKYMDILFYDAETKKLLSREHVDLDNTSKNEGVYPVYKKDMYVVVIANTPTDMEKLLQVGTSLDDLLAPMKNKSEYSDLYYFNHKTRYNYVPMSNSQGPVLISAKDISAEYTEAQENPIKIEIECICPIIIVNLQEMEISDRFFFADNIVRTAFTSYPTAKYRTLMRPLNKLAGGKDMEKLGDGSSPRDRYAAIPFDNLNSLSEYYYFNPRYYMEHDKVYHPDNKRVFQRTIWETVPNTEKPVKGNTPYVTFCIRLLPKELEKYNEKVEAGMNANNISYYYMGYFNYKTDHGFKVASYEEFVNVYNCIMEKKKSKNPAFEKILKKYLDNGQITVTKDHSHYVIKYKKDEKYLNEGFTFRDFEYHVLGKNYFIFYPQHFDKEQRGGSDYGKFGLVRNNIYIFNIKKISNEGYTSLPLYDNNNEEVKIKENYGNVIVEKTESPIHEYDLYF